MELPKNITQIGEADKHCRIYVEDYVVSYIKQMNGMAQNKGYCHSIIRQERRQRTVWHIYSPMAPQS